MCLLVAVDGDSITLFLDLNPGTDYSGGKTPASATPFPRSLQFTSAIPLPSTSEQRDVFDLAGWQFDIAFDPARP